MGESKRRKKLYKNYGKFHQISSLSELSHWGDRLFGEILRLIEANASKEDISQMLQASLKTFEAKDHHRIALYLFCWVLDSCLSNNRVNELLYQLVVQLEPYSDLVAWKMMMEAFESVRLDDGSYGRGDCLINSMEPVLIQFSQWLNSPEFMRSGVSSDFGLDWQGSEEQDRPFEIISKQIFTSGDKILDSNLEPIEFKSARELEEYMQESANKQDLKKLKRAMKEAVNNF